MCSFSNTVEKTSLRYNKQNYKRKRNYVSKGKKKKTESEKKISRNLKNILIVLKMILVIYIVMSYIAYLKVESPE